MAVHKLHLDEFDEVDYQLIAIHTSLEDYRLAYYINQQIPIVLSKNKEQIGVTTKEGEALFSIFSFTDKVADVQWNLVQNKNEITTRKKSTGQNLFLNTEVEIETKVFLLPELKKVDYILKIDQIKDTVFTDKIILALNKIEKITTVYAVDTEKIKSKNNLIF